MTNEEFLESLCRENPELRKSVWMNFDKFFEPVQNIHAALDVAWPEAEYIVRPPYQERIGRLVAERDEAKVLLTQSHKAVVSLHTRVIHLTKTMHSMVLQLFESVMKS